MRSRRRPSRSGARIARGKPCAIEGVAFDGGSGIAKVDVSVDGGASFREARLDPDLGRFSFRRYRTSWTPDSEGPRAILVRATAVSGATQALTPGWNRAGYMRNVVERTEVTVIA